MRFTSLGSGSKGNATLIEAGDTRILMDCGFARSEFSRRMVARGLDPHDIDAILVTHEHGDHAGGVGAIARHWQIPIYLTYGTAVAARIGDVPRRVVIEPGQRFAIGDIEVDPVAVPHDAREPVQFVFRAEGSVLGILTDLGSVTPHVIAAYGGCDALLLEFNHDVERLGSGPYPPALKRRVGGDYGHLNNHQAASLLEAADTSRLHTLVVGHISEQNNTEALAATAIAGCVSLAGVRVIYACQGDGFEWLSCVQSSPAVSLAAGGTVG